MFNDLNNANGSGQPVVDDIFAETDKPSNAGLQSDIETHNVGLANSSDNLSPVHFNQVNGGSKGYFKFFLILLIVLLVLVGAYFVYTQFFKSDINELPASEKTNNPTSTSINTPVTNNEIIEFVPSIPGVIPGSPVNPVVVASTTELDEATSTPEVVPVSNIDSDSDGLSDAEEKTAGTNINIIDTDNDGLSDYEEIKIYHTDPLSTDTDKDGYLDGAEVKGGYDPNGPGKLPGNSPKL